MQQVIRESAGEFWRPVKGSAKLAEAVLPETLCQQCATEFAIGARFCHVCGFDRESLSSELQQSGHGLLLDLEILRQRLGLGVPTMICFLGGLICLVVAAFSGFGAGSAVEWQVRTAHIFEWLLAGIAALLAGVLLKT